MMQIAYLLTLPAALVAVGFVAADLYAQRHRVLRALRNDRRGAAAEIEMGL